MSMKTRIFIVIGVVVLIGAVLITSRFTEKSKGLKAGFDSEFFTRPDGYPGLKKHYDFEFPVEPPPDEVQWIARKRDTRANAEVQLEDLPHTHDGAEVRVALPLEFRIQFFCGFDLRFGGDRAEQPYLVLFQEFYGSIR